MTKALSAALKQELIEARENEALDELHKLGFRVTLHTMGRYVEGDDLLGIVAGYKPGDCYAVMYGRDGKRKHVAGTSALDALQQAQSWWHWQLGLKDDAANKFVPSVDHEPTEATIVQRIASSEVTRRSHDGTERKILGFASVAAELVDQHGTPMHEESHTSQFSEADNKETTIR